MKTLLLAVMITAVASPAFAKGPPPWANGPPSWANGPPTFDAPLPLAAGIPALLLVGGAFAMARAARKG